MDIDTEGLDLTSLGPVDRTSVNHFTLAQRDLKYQHGVDGSIRSEGVWTVLGEKPTLYTRL